MTTVIVMRPRMAMKIRSSTIVNTASVVSGRADGSGVSFIESHTAAGLSRASAFPYEQVSGRHNTA